MKKFNKLFKLKMKFSNFKQKMDPDGENNNFNIIPIEPSDIVPNPDFSFYPHEQEYTIDEHHSSGETYASLDDNYFLSSLLRGKEYATCQMTTRISITKEVAHEYIDANRLFMNNFDLNNEGVPIDKDGKSYLNDKVDGAIIINMEIETR